MLVENALIPTGEQLGVVAGDQRTGPIVMLNLLKFRARAAYADGRDADCTGEQAYQRYADQMVPYVESRGGRLLYQGDARALVIGAVGEVWDTVALVEYPSPRTFLEIAMAPEVHAFAVHREAGLEGQLLLMLEPR
jgi:uncharacterized protein (DUF1330 family)